MRTTFQLEGLDCANCAAKIERGVQQIAGVRAATVNFLTAKLMIEGADENFDEIVRSANAIVKKVGPDMTARRIS